MAKACILSIQARLPVLEPRPDRVAWRRSNARSCWARVRNSTGRHLHGGLHRSCSEMVGQGSCWEPPSPAVPWGGAGPVWAYREQSRKASIRFHEYPYLYGPCELKAGGKNPNLLTYGFPRAFVTVGRSILGGRVTACCCRSWVYGSNAGEPVHFLVVALQVEFDTQSHRGRSCVGAQ